MCHEDVMVCDTMVGRKDAECAHASCLAGCRQNFMTHLPSHGIRASTSPSASSTSSGRWEGCRCMVVAVSQRRLPRGLKRCDEAFPASPVGLGTPVSTPARQPQALIGLGIHQLMARYQCHRGHQRPGHPWTCNFHNPRQATGRISCRHRLHIYHFLCLRT